MNRPVVCCQLMIVLLVACCGQWLLAAPIDEIDPPQWHSTEDEPVAARRESIVQSLHELYDLDEIRQAKEALLAGNVELCREKLRAAYAKHPHLSPPELMLARLFLSGGQFDKGRQLLEEFSIADPNHPELYLLFGKLALVDGRVTDAIVHFQKADSFELPEVWTDAQRAYFKRESASGKTKIAEMRGDWDVAAQLYQQQVKSRPQDAFLRERFASTLFRDGQLRQAYEQFDIAYRQNPQLTPPETSMAVMCVQQANYRQAETWFEKALTRYPENPNSHFLRSFALMHEDRCQEAERHSAKAAELGLDHEAFLMHRGAIAMQLAKYDRAAEFFQTVGDRNALVSAKTSLALALAEQDDVDKRKQALDLIKDVAQEHPQFPMAKTMLGWVQFRNGQSEDAEKSLKEAATQLPSDPTTMLFLSRVLMQQKKEDEARQAAERLSLLIDRPGIWALRPAARKWISEVLRKDN